MWTLHYSLFKQGITAFFWPLFGFGMLSFVLWGIWITWKEQREVRRAGKKPDKLALPFLTFMTLFPIGFLATEGYDVVHAYFESASALWNGDYEVVEGRVENFKTNLGARNLGEHFTVNGISFGYWDSLESIGYHRIKRRGGPIDEGKYVRIYYKEKKILKLWVKR